MSWAGEKPFTSYFYFNDVKQAKVKIKFTVEGGQAPRLEGVRIFAKPDVIYRQFSGGLVLANPSQAPVKIDLAKRFPGIAYARIPGTPLQDPKTNNGKRVGNILVLPPRDALFLRTLKPTNK